MQNKTEVSDCRPPSGTSSVSRRGLSLFHLSSSLKGTVAESFTYIRHTSSNVNVLTDFCKARAPLSKKTTSVLQNKSLCVPYKSSKIRKFLAHMFITTSHYQSYTNVPDIRQHKAVKTVEIMKMRKKKTASSKSQEGGRR